MGAQPTGLIDGVGVETALEPAFVAAHHVFRLLLLSILIPVMLAWERSPQD